MSIFDKIPEKPEFPEAAASINEFLTTLWGIKDDWNAIRTPIVGIKGTFSEACGFEGSINQMVQGSLLAMSKDLHSVAGKTTEDHIEDFSACLSCDMNSPYIHFTISDHPLLGKYVPIVEALGAVVPAFESSIESITGMIEKC